MTNLKTKLIFTIIICIITYLVLDKEIIKADSNIDTDIQFGIGQNFRIYPSGVHQTEPFIAKDPSNPQILFTACNTLNPTTAFRSEGVYSSTNGGTNWFGSDTCKGNPIILHQGDPGVAIDKNGDFILLRLGYPQGLYSHYSTDLGVTWSSQRTISINPEDLDRGTIMSDGNPSSSYYGRTYVTWVRFSSPFPAYFSYTDNIAGSWSSPAQINNPPQRCQGAEIAMAPNGVVNVCWAQVTNTSPFTEDRVGFASSGNGGANWTVLENAFDMNGIQGILPSKGNIRVNGLPRLDVDKTGGTRNGWIYIVTTQKNLAPAGTDPDIIMNRSTDEGQTWSSGIRVNQDPLNDGKIQYFPAVHVDDSGGVNVLYYDDRNTTSDSTGVFLSRSTDGGSTWKDIEMSDHNFKPTPIGGFGQGYQGDNIALMSTNNNLISIWMDNITGVYQLWSVIADISSLGIQRIGTSVPSEFELKQNYPNPFNPATTIQVYIPVNDFVELTVYDISGKEVAELINQELKAGVYNVSFASSGLPSGVYFYTLRSSEFVQTRKMLYVK
ncbi:MAG: T9SS type A sorting domain-containing protein [Ignavibacteria bacterium]|nr:T9SS type A sorting domain-containing protein [Ignavibacteria bacterium]